MGKKKQPDFQKTKLRVGRTLPKGRNVTDTSFKTKKIAVPSQKIEKPALTGNLEDHLKLVGHHNPKTQMNALQWVCHYVQGNFSVEHLPLILEKAERATLDVDGGVRQAAIKLLEATLTHSSSLQVEGHIRSIVCSLRCGMTHGDIKIRKDALHFLDVLLRNHPKLLSNYHSLLSTILDMISSRFGGKSHRKKRRTLPAVYDNDIKSQAWRMEVLKRFYSLLNIIVDSFSIKDEDKEEGKTLYWSALKPLSLDLIPGRDLEPIEYDLAKDLNFLSLNVDSQSWSSDRLKVLIDEITPVLMDVFAEEVSEFISQIRDPWSKCGVASGNSSLANCSLPAEVAGNVNVITQIFCLLGKWIQILSKTDRKLEAWFVDKFCNICESLMKGFPYWIKIRDQQNYSTRNAESSAIRLNLSLSFLCCGFNAERNTCVKYRNTILKYLNKVANMRHEIRVDSIPMVIRIVKAQLQSKHLELETATIFLHSLCESIKKPNHPADLHFMEFFTELVTDVNLQDFVLPNTKELFFRILLQEMISMCSANNVNPQLLKCFKRICSLGQKEFLQTLQALSPKLMTLLKQNNDESHEVAALLLCHQDIEIDSLMQIGEIILDNDFSQRTALCIIYTLADRFAKNTGLSKKDIRVAAMKFLINVAVDTFAILDAENVEKEEDFHFHEMWAVVEDYCSYKIVPSAQWKRHSKIFRACIDCLSSFPQKEALQCIFIYCRNILIHYSTFPVHSAIALWKLQREFPFSSDQQYNTSYDALLFSCVLFSSVYAPDCRNGEHLTYGVSELLNSIDFQKRANDVLNHLEAECLRINHVDAVESFVRIFYFFINNKCFGIEHRTTIYAILSHLEDQFGENLTGRTLYMAVRSLL